MPPGLSETLTSSETVALEPKEHTGRTLILCFDGTSNCYDQKNTNAMRLFTCFEKGEPQQLVYYQTGVGTTTKSRLPTRFGTWFSKMIDQALAWHLRDNISRGYNFLQMNWRPGDKICIFGFSRGAYIARALAGMIQTVGLLPETVPEQVEFAYEIYRTLGRKFTMSHLSHDYKRDLSRHVTVDFLGVWDTVTSVGLLFPQTLPFSQTSGSFKVFRQAFALDERRMKYAPSPYALPVAEQTLENGSWKTTQGGIRLASPNFSHWDNFRHWHLGLLGFAVDILMTPTHLFIGWLPLALQGLRREMLLNLKTENNKRLIPAKSMVPQGRPPDVKEVWFAGGHGDVGGGNSKDVVKTRNPHPQPPTLGYMPALSNIPLRWMIRELYEADQRYNLNIRWRPVQLARYGIYLPPLPLTNDPPNNISSSSTLTIGNRVIEPYPSLETYPPQIVHYESTPDIDEARENDRRRAKFTRCLLYKSDVLIDLDYHEADLAAPMTDRIWMWEQIWKYDGMQEWENRFPSAKQAMEWIGHSSHIFASMVLWWFLEFWPYVKMVRSGGKFRWQTKFE
ncbi:uncharacterized protein EI90DRAFT_3124029 [Cantharellus anzutake]|uniref:uncharacterized protein n=1 Tax=Cantharellus anzutake TaxID=1750568 RepID=UPI0019076472|nr:uncharacterized protein EI90DRAFT_3124029 [Cantharellus anzutake]KAF8330814.1 hypothetical protein EI90DRAFT_3124029 [Cantharellus anzutake]